MASYDPKTYWENRLSKKELDVDLVGYAGLGLTYNRWLYRKRYHSLKGGIKKLQLDIQSKTILDCGVGSGAYLPFWEQFHPKSITGIDITQTSVDTLRVKYPKHNFMVADISQRNSLINIQSERFDIVTVFDVLFHITDDLSFKNAIENIAMITHPGSWLLISDGFCNIPYGPFHHEYHRNKHHYEQILNSSGFKEIHIEPVFYLMSTPLCKTESLSARFAGLILRLISKLERHKLGTLNNLIGLLLFTYDVNACNIGYPTNGIKILFAKKI